MEDDEYPYPYDDPAEPSYADPRLKDLKPGWMRLREWLWFGLLHLMCVLLGGVGVLVLACVYAFRDALPWYVLVPVALSGLTTLISAVRLDGDMWDAKKRLARKRGVTLQRPDPYDN